MKFIRKTSSEPQDLISWKAQNPQMNWEDFKSRETCGRLRTLLLQEQGYICCYCEREIDEHRGHFEHVVPRSFKDKNGVAEGRQRELDYHNIVFSCTKMNKPIDEKGDKVTCGHPKGDWYDENLFVTPLQENCESLFHYKNVGTVVPVDGPDSGKAQATIDRLKLNGEPLDDELESFLVRERKRVIDGLWNIWRQDYFETDFSGMRRWAESELSRFPRDQLAPFWTTKRQVFEEILGTKLTIQ